MARLICRLSWNQPLPSANAAAEVDIAAWLIPCQWSANEQLELAWSLDTLAEAFPGLPFSLECTIQHPLTPAGEARFADALGPYLRHPRNLQIGNRPLLWIRQPEQLSHPLFGLQRLRNGLGGDPLLLAASPPEQTGWEGAYGITERIPRQHLSNGQDNYESFLFHAHHHPDPGGLLAVPCVTGDVSGTLAHSSPDLYQQWIAQVSAWCDLRQPNPNDRWVLVERWDDHRQWWSKPDVVPAEYPAAHQPVERAWGVMEAHQPALLIHGFHQDLLSTILTPLAADGASRSTLALYISTPQHQLDAVEQMVRNQGWPAACLVGVENRGRDIAPFLLELLPRAFAQGHPWLVKLHTKRSPDKPGGSAWGTQLVNSLASRESLARIAERFASAPDLNLLVPHGCLLPASVHLAGNQQHLRQLLEQGGLDPASWMHQVFAAGSMWAARTSALAPLLSLPLGLQQFEAEQGQTDGTLAHACERLIPALLKPGSGDVQELTDAPFCCPPFGFAWADGRP